jgi:phosphatidylglycerophosphate synthase
VPVDDFELLTRVGGTSALRSLAEREDLIGTPVSECFGRQLHTQKRFDRAEDDCFDDLAASGTEGVFEALIGRSVSRLITLKLLGTSVSPSTISVVAGVLAMAAAGLLALGHAVAAVVAALLAIASAILDRTDGELARLRLEDDEGQRTLDFGLDHITHAVLFLGLAYGVHHPAAGVGGWSMTLTKLDQFLPGIHKALTGAHVSALTVGLFAAGGVLLLLVVLFWRGLPSSNSTGLRRVGDTIATAFGSRDYFYLLLFAAVANLIPGLSEQGFLGVFLLVTAVLVYGSFAVLFLVSLVAPRPQSA